MGIEELSAEISDLRAILREWQPSILALKEHSTLDYYTRIQNLKKEIAAPETSIHKAAELIREVTRLEAQAELLESLKGLKCSTTKKAS